MPWGDRVYHDAVAEGGNWTGAHTTIDPSYTSGADEFIAVASVHQETGSAIDLDSSGNDGPNAKYISVNKDTDAYEPSTIINLETTSTTDDINIEAGISVAGLRISSGDLIALGGDSNERATFKDFYARLTNSGNYFTIGTADFIETQFVVNASPSTSGIFQGTTVDPLMRIYGGSLTGTGLGSHRPFRGTLNVFARGFDMSAIGANTGLFNSTANGWAVFDTCRFPAGYDYDQSLNNHNIKIINPIESSTTIAVGLVTTDIAGYSELTDAYRISGTTVSGQARCLVTTTNDRCDPWAIHHEVIEFPLWFGTTGSRTMTFRVATNTTLNQGDMWVDMMLPAGASDSTMEYHSGQPDIADYISGSFSALATDSNGSTDWENNVGGPSGLSNFYEVSLTATVHQVGQYTARLLCAKASASGIYTHPECIVTT